MIYSYGVSLPGSYHLQKGIVCQDSYKIITCNEYMAIAVVADGLGSAEYSDIGSQMAATSAAEYCQKNINPSRADIIETIRGSFASANSAIELEAKLKGRGTESYDTTLALAVLIHDELYYGQSGDSGIIALTSEGRYEAVTRQQRDEDGRVFPLHFKDKWEFDKFKHKVSAVLLATDGMLETFFPFYIRNAPVNIHISLAQFFMDKNSLQLEAQGQEAAQAKILSFMENIPPEQVNDDKTIAVLINTSVITMEQSEEYYREPDWVALKKKYDAEWRREAYPEMFMGEPEPVTETNEDPPQKILSALPVSEERKTEKRGVNKVLVFILVILFLAAVALGTFWLLGTQEGDIAIWW